MNAISFKSAKKSPEKFKVRPGYDSGDLLIEFCGDHRSQDYPNIYKLLTTILCAKIIEHPQLNTLDIALTADDYIYCYEYANGRFELVDDVWGCCIHSLENNYQVITDIEKALIKSTLFLKEDVDFSRYQKDL